jgi:uncharacterized membrane protein
MCSLEQSLLERLLLELLGMTVFARTIMFAGTIVFARAIVVGTQYQSYLLVLAKASTFFF